MDNDYPSYSVDMRQANISTYDSFADLRGSADVAQDLCNATAVWDPAAVTVLPAAAGTQDVVVLENTNLQDVSIYSEVRFTDPMGKSFLPVPGKQGRMNLMPLSRMGPSASATVTSQEVLSDTVTTPQVSSTPQPARHRSHSPVRLQPRWEECRVRDEDASSTSDRRDKEEDKVYDPYFDDLLGDLRNFFPEAIDPVTANSVKNLVLFQEETDKAPDRRLPGSVYHSSLDDVLVGMVQGKRVGRSDKPFLKGSLLTPPPLQVVIRPYITEPQQPPLEWFTLTGQLGSAAKLSFTVTSKDFDTLESLAHRNLAVSSFQEWFNAYLGHCLQQPDIDIPHVLKVVKSLGLAISQLAKDSAFVVANISLLRCDAMISALPRNVKEEDIRKLQTVSCRGEDLFIPDTVEAAEQALRGYNTQQALLNMMSLKQNTSYSVSKSSRYDYRDARPKDQGSHSAGKSSRSQQKREREGAGGRGRPYQIPKGQRSQEWNSAHNWKSSDQNTKKESPYQQSSSRKGGRGGGHI